MQMCGNDLHELRTQADRLGTECRRCVYKRQATYRERQRLGLALIHDLENRAVRVDDLTVGTGYELAFRWANAIDDFELARIEQEHPALISKLRARIDRIVAGDDD